MAEFPEQLLIRVDPGPDADDELREETTRQLRGALVDADIGSVQQLHEATTPAGVKGVPASLGNLLVTLGASGGALTVLIGALQSWLTRSERCSVTIELGNDKMTLKGASSEEQQRLVNAFIRNHTAPRSG